MAQPLRPLDHPIAIFPQYIAQTQPTTLLMKGSSLWKASFDITFTGDSTSTAALYGTQPQFEQSYNDGFSANLRDPYAAPSPYYSTEISERRRRSEYQVIPESPNILRIEPETLSISHRMHVYDGTTSIRLCTIRRETLSFRSRYYAEISEGSPRLFESEALASWGRKNLFHFQNQAGKCENIELRIKSPVFSQRQEVYLGDQMVGLIEIERWHLKKHYNLTATQGLDIFVLVCIAVLVDDQIRSEND